MKNLISRGIGEQRQWGRHIIFLCVALFACSCASSGANRGLERSLVFGALMTNENYLVATKRLHEGNTMGARALLEQALAASVVELEQLRGTPGGLEYAEEIDRQLTRARELQDEWSH